MENNNLTFDKLPEAVCELTCKVDRIEQLLLLKSASDADEDNLLTIDQAAKFLNLAKQSIYGKVSRNEIPVLKPAGTKRLYFSKADLLVYLKSGRQKTRDEIKADAGSCLLRKNK
ncbi:MAG: DNA-binding protein [Marinilabiliales bacterium]|nr:MAG: DNA-binding protein [Marinilabiliales bacterium]